MTDLRTQLADVITALVDPYEHAETYEHELQLRSPVPDGTPTKLIKTRRVHRIHMPALIDQLAEAIEPGGVGDDGRRIPGSKPAARLDAIDRLLAIQAATAMWLWHARVRPADSLAVNLRKLVGVDWQPEQLDALTRSAKRWLTWARVVTGWDTPPWTPKGPCPACDVKGSLRVRLDQRTGCCVDCGAAWDPTTIGVLAQHIRESNGEAA